jgi:drug/metabolite transporter (DMT)-like permease
MLSHSAVPIHSCHARHRIDQPIHRMNHIEPNYIKAASLKIMATLMLSLMTLCVRMLGEAVPLGETVFVRSFFTLLMIVAMLALQRQLRTALKTKRAFGHVVRSTISIVGVFSLYGALVRLPIVEVTAITFIAPLATVILAALVLREHVWIYRWVAVLVGFSGGLFILVPRLGLFGAGVSAAAGWDTTIGIGLALVSMFCIAAATIQIRSLTSTESTASITFYMALSMSVVGLATLPFGWITPSWHQLAILLGAGLSGSLGQLFFTEGMRHAPASFIAPFEYLALIWAFIFGYFVLNEVPTGNVMIGAVIVAMAGLFVIWRERRLGLRRDREAIARATP